MARGDWAGAADLARRGLELASDNGAVRASLHHRLGTALSQAQGPAAAREQFLLALTAVPTLARAHFSLAVLALQEGDTGEAIRRLQTALQHEPDYVEARVTLGDVLRSMGRWPEALAEYERALQAGPDHKAARFGEAVTLVRLGRDEAARDRLQEASSGEPSNVQWRTALARVLSCPSASSTRDARRAVTLVEPIMRSSPSLDAAETLAMALAGTGAFPEAAELQRRVIDNASATGRNDLLPVLRMNLQRYEQRQPCQVPWGYEPLYEGP
jgi:tetratricopeptide (TPR) repeat protein